MRTIFLLAALLGASPVRADELPLSTIEADARYTRLLARLDASCRGFLRDYQDVWGSLNPASADPGRVLVLIEELARRENDEPGDPPVCGPGSAAALVEFVEGRAVGEDGPELDGAVILLIQTYRPPGGQLLLAARLRSPNGLLRMAALKASGVYGLGDTVGDYIGSLPRPCRDAARAMASGAPDERKAAAFAALLGEEDERVRRFGLEGLLALGRRGAQPHLDAVRRLRQAGRVPPGGDELVADLVGVEVAPRPGRVADGVLQAGPDKPPAQPSSDPSANVESAASGPGGPGGARPGELPPPRGEPIQSDKPAPPR